MARLCTLKDWLEAFERKQQDDLRFFREVLSRGEVISGLSRELRRRLRERQAYSSFFKRLSWHHLSAEELSWCEKKMEEILRREDELRRLLDRLLSWLEQTP
ncbi:hypothetical protein [Thermosulfurimonas sp.]|uniref:hypothetical protein n=1 Tax=Thermosulfurimonas sp. TaxID=2080236 RepID=UPI0025F9148F|nr:hypothetical protein [Thermosulfurimonas sp.]